MLAPIALAVALLAALLSATLWLSFAGGAARADRPRARRPRVRGARKRHERSWLGIAAIVLSVFAMLVLPALFVVCDEVACV
jgi:ABC-type Fe3+ transport system permease subunit